MIVKFTSKYKIVKWTESRVSKHFPSNKNYLELFLLIFGISNRFICGKRSRQKTEELSCSSMVYCPSHGSTRQIFLILSSNMKTI
jgi:hypothetical protein